MMKRRELLFGSAAAALAGAPQQGHYTVGITTNTRGGWEKDVFLSFREAHEVGYRNVETFISYFHKDYWTKPQELKKRIGEIGVRFVTISNSGPLEMHFEDPSRHEKVVEDHVALGRYIRNFGCTHLKINLGPRRAEGTTKEDLKQIAKVLNILGKRLTGEGVKLAIHAHMWNQFENRAEIEAVLGATDARHVWFVLDTGHITMAGMDPVKLAGELGHRIVEFHMKDTKPAWRGGAPKRLERPDMMADPPFFALGSGGVDFGGLKAHLDSIGWRGFLTVELDTSPMRPPKESARKSFAYLRKELGLPEEAFRARPGS
ncbi:MAG: sugar phosphate isomerase/epimerase family protein [Bryobacteraceae bacterium]